MQRTGFVLAILLALYACEGPMGPVGPPGPGTRIVLSAVTDSLGEASVALPAEAGTMTSLPAITCYVSGDGSAWFVIAFDSDATSVFSACIVEEAVAGNLLVTVLASADLLVRIVVVY